MASRDFNPVFAFFAICVFIQWKEVSMQNNWAMYYKETENADFGIRMHYQQSEGPTMSIIISYDTETQSATNFFKSQISAELIDNFNSCNVITWHFNTCTTSKLDGATLVCGLGTTQCYMDQVHSCITKALEGNQSGMGKFLICRLAAGKATAQCGLESGVKEEDFKKCVNNGNGAKLCDNFHTLFQDARSKRTQEETESTSKFPNAITDFKNVVCQVLAQGALKCDAVCGHA